MLRDKTFLGLNLSVFLMMIGVGMIVARLPARIVELDGSGRNAGYLASMFAAAYIAFQIPVGSMADKFGFKRFLVMGYLLCFLAGLCFYFSGSAYAMFMSRVVQGAGEAPIWALAPALLSVKYPASKGSVMGVYNAVLHIGLTVGPVLGVYLVNVMHPSGLFLIYACACLGGAAMICLLTEDVRLNGGFAASFSLSGILRLSRSRGAFITLLGITLYGAGYGVFLTSIPVYLRQAKGFDDGYTGAFFSLFYVAISFSQLVTGHLADRYGSGVFMVSGLFIASAGMAAIPAMNLSGALPVLSALTAASLGLGIFYLASMIFLNETAGEECKGAISGAYYLFWGLGMFFGPPVLSTLSNRMGFGIALVSFSLLLLSESVIMLAKGIGKTR